MLRIGARRLNAEGIKERLAEAASRFSAPNFIQKASCCSLQCAAYIPFARVAMQSFRKPSSLASLLNELLFAAAIIYDLPPCHVTTLRIRPEIT